MWRPIDIGKVCVLEWEVCVLGWKVCVLGWKVG